MFTRLFRVLRRLVRAKEAESDSSQGSQTPLSGDLQRDLSALENLFDRVDDLVIQSFFVGGDESVGASVVYLDGMIDAARVEETVIEPLMLWARPRQLGDSPSGRQLAGRIQSTVLPAHRAVEVSTLEEMVDGILDGDLTLLVQDVDTALVMDAKEFMTRSVEEPGADVAVRGSREGFIDHAAVNVTLLRRRIRSTRLKAERLRMGHKSRTDVRLIYIEGVAQKDVVDEMRRRLDDIDVDMVDSSRLVQNLAGDRPHTVFPCMHATERPDTVAHGLAEGRVAVFVDNDPFVLVAPSTFFGFFTTAEQYNLNFYVASFVRVVSIGAFLLSVLLTPTYVAMTTFHHELIPMPLLLNIAAAEAGLPLPVGATAFVVEVMLEVIREAGARLPTAVGQAAGIIGAVVLGQAAIEAAFVGPGLVIVAATATIASFAIPQYEATSGWRLLRFPLLLMGSVLGFYGISIAVVVIVMHLASLKTFGIPFLSLYPPGRVSELGEEVLQMPEAYRRPVRPGAVWDRWRRGEPPVPRDPDTGRRYQKERLR